MNRFGPEWNSLYAAIWATRSIAYAAGANTSDVVKLADMSLLALLDYRIPKTTIWKQRTTHLRIGKVKSIEVAESTMVTLDSLDFRTLEVCPTPFKVPVSFLLAEWDIVPADIVEFRLDRNTGNMRGFRKDEPLQKHMSR